MGERAGGGGGKRFQPVAVLNGGGLNSRAALGRL